MSAEFLVITLVVVATPGIGVMYTLSAGLSRGARASVIAAVGCTLGILPHMLAAVTGVAALLNAGAVAFETLRYLGVAYLLYLAFATWRDRTELLVRESAPRSTARVIVSAVLINLLNPKLTIFFFAFLPQFVSPSDPNAVSLMLGLSGVFMVVTLAVFVLYGFLAAAVRDRIVGHPRVLTWMRRSFAAAFVMLGLRLAVSDR